MIYGFMLLRKRVVISDNCFYNCFYFKVFHQFDYKWEE